jgi:hypothetical protein
LEKLLILDADMLVEVFSQSTTGHQNYEANEAMRRQLSIAGKDQP